MSGTGESPADEDPGVGNPDENNVEAEELTKDLSDAETEPAMLEDEEMPTYMSLTSSSRPDETGAEIEVSRHPEDNQVGEERASSPYAASEQGAESVCVLSSGEESDRDRRPYELMNDYDSDDMDMDEEEDEDDDEEDDSCMNDEEDSDGDIEPEQFERSSDDFVLRYDGGLEKHHKERSRSLQDLTNSRGNLSRFVGKRRSIDLVGGYETGFPRQNFLPHQDPLGVRKKMPRSVRYDHVPSKVKMYIQEMKEQSRRSAERKIRENLVQKNFTDSNTRGENPDVVTCTRLNPANRMIKNYVQNATNEITTTEQSELADDEIYDDLDPMENRPELMVMSTPDEIREIAEREKYSKENATAENLTISSDPLVKNGKTNGLIDYSTRNNIEKIMEPIETCPPNGQEQIAAILNLRSLSYEEYTNGEQIPDTKINIDNLPHPTIEEKNGIVDYTEEIFAEPELKMSSPKIEISKVPQPSPAEIHEIRETWDLRKSMNEKFDEMSTTLKQKNAQIDHMRDAYQKTLTENMSLRRELNELRKTLEQCKAENQPRETKAASVQTEIVMESEKTDLPIEESKAPIVKLSSSSVTSALSSLEQWSDSNCSPAISIDPPNIGLTSDDSLAGSEQTPRKSARLSHSFITSSRILQTLANITQGRTKSSSTISHVDETARSNSRLGSEQGQSKRKTNTPLISENEENPSRAKKRKASDMLDGISQPFKIPHIPGDVRKKMNSDSDTDGVVKMDRQGRTSEPNDDERNETGERTGEDIHDTEATDVPENVKCFVYHEEPDSNERSFLIQAEDDSKNEATDKGGAVRECGPYLLGNVEIRMSEANGTINIWGKEVSQSTDDADVEMEESEVFERPSFTSRSSHDCQSTPRSKFLNRSTFVCSTNKKSRISPQFARSPIGKYLRPGLSNLTRTSNVATNESPSGRYASSPRLDNQNVGCERCENHKKPVKWPSCEHLANSRVKKHSCCLHDVEIDERNCDCAQENDDATIFESMSNIWANQHKCTNTLHNVTMKHSCANEGNRRNSGNCHRHSAGHEEDFRQTNKRCSSCADESPSCSTRLTPGNLPCRDNRNRSHSHVSCEDDEHPLLSNEMHCETSETKRRRLSGRKVRGILTDLLRGCGGCREPHSTSSLAKGSASSPNTIPKVRPSSCASPQAASCSKRPTCYPSHSNHPSNDLNNEKSCASCSRRIEMRAEIESQLEILRVDMERLHSRSDAFLQMLNLLNVDTD